MRGFLGGVSVGAVVAVIGAAVWSLSIPLPRPVEVPSEDPAPILAPRVEASLPEDTPSGDADVVERAPQAPADVEASAGNEAAIDTDTAEKPEVATSVPDTETELSTTEAPQATVPDGTAPSPVVTGTAPSQPGDEDQPSATTESATAPAPVVTDEPGLMTPDVGGDAPVLTPEGSQTAGVTKPVDVPTIETPELGDAPDSTLPPSISTPAPAPNITTEEAPEPEGQVRIADLPQATGTTEDTGPAIGTRVVPLTDRDKEPAPEAAPAAGTPFERNSVSADPAAGLPLMSIILIEEEGSVGAEALEEFPYPLTFAIDPSDPKAAERMAARRAAGFEVMILADLPREGGAQDAETALPIWFDRLPDAMGILEGIETGVQGNRPLADQVSAIAKDAGYGLVMQDNGLNTVQKMALREGVPAGVVFRDFDGAGQDPRAMRRFLDQAAFRAGQEGAVIMLGRLKPDTISALLVWGLQDRANRVALVPTSTSLKRMLDPLN